MALQMTLRDNVRFATKKGVLYAQMFECEEEFLNGMPICPKIISAWGWSQT